jgi:RF-1 domain
MSAVHPACLPVEKLLAECDVRHERRSGPGGQHRNKVSTAVVLTHRPTGLRAEANEERSQADNHREAVRRLRVRLAVEVRSENNAAARTSELWRSRVSNRRLAVNPGHADFPALLAEALDAVAAAEYDVSAAADSLEVSSSQLMKFLKDAPTAWASVAEARRQRGLRPLH